MTGERARPARRSAFERACERQVSGLPLAFYRIAFSLVLLGEVGQLWRYRRLIFDPVPFVSRGAFWVEPLLIVWFAAGCLLVLGLHTRIAAAVSYFATLATISHFGIDEYHYDYTLTTAGFLLLLFPVSASLSLDRLRIQYGERRILVSPADKAGFLKAIGQDPADARQ